jgi:hypothetical protein
VELAHQDHHQRAIGRGGGGGDPFSSVAVAKLQRARAARAAIDGDDLKATLAGQLEDGAEAGPEIEGAAAAVADGLQEAALGAAAAEVAVHGGLETALHEFEGEHHPAAGVQRGLDEGAVRLLGDAERVVVADVDDVRRQRAVAHLGEGEGTRERADPGAVAPLVGLECGGGPFHGAGDPRALPPEERQVKRKRGSHAVRGRVARAKGKARKRDRAPRVNIRRFKV